MVEEKKNKVTFLEVLFCFFEKLRHINFNLCLISVKPAVLNRCKLSDRNLSEGKNTKQNSKFIIQVKVFKKQKLNILQTKLSYF